MIQMRLPTRTLLPLLGVLFFAGCNDLTDLSSISGDASGTYNLSLVNNVPVPAIISVNGNTTDRLTGGSFVLRSDSTFTETLTFDETVSGQTTTSSSTCDGTYSQRGGSFDFTEATSDDPTCGGTYTGSWNGGTSFTFPLGTAVLIYIKETPAA